MKYFCQLLCTLIAVMAVSISEAQIDVDQSANPAADTSETIQESEKERQAEIEAKKKEAERAAAASKKKADEVFIPTEEISEDKPVAFPVDI